MDDLTPYVGNAEMFPILKSWDFFNHAGVSPLPHASAQAVIDYAWQSQTHSYVNSGWQAMIQETRALAARLINADKSQIAFVKNTSEGLSIVANAIDWNPGDIIVTTNVEYPANMYPWMNIASLHGVKLNPVPEEPSPTGGRAVPLEKLLEAIAQPRVRLLALSHVEFGSGQRHDLEQIGRACRDRNVLFVVDAIQSLGAVPIDVKKMPIDYLSCGGQKWLLSPEGTGLFYCRPELLEKTRPLTIGCTNVVNAMDFAHYDFTLRPDSGRFESGGQNIAGLVALRESLKLLLTIGSAPIAQRLKSLGDRLITGLTAKGYTIASPRDGHQWSGIISFTSSNPEMEKTAAQLRQDHRTELVVRHGRFRASPHFYNTEAQIDRLIGLLPGR